MRLSITHNSKQILALGDAFWRHVKDNFFLFLHVIKINIYKDFRFHNMSSRNLRDILIKINTYSKIWSLSDCNWTQSQNHLVRKRTLKHLAELAMSRCGFESSCSYINFRFRTCFEQGVPWRSGNCKVWIHSEKSTWHDKNIQSTYSKVGIVSTCLVFLQDVF